MIPETQYARHAGLHVAYQVLGEGPPDILLLDQWFSHMDAQWDVLPLAEFRERLASFGRLIMYDKRGSGLSDPLAPNQLPTVEEWMGDIPIVLDAVGSERAAVITNLGAGIMATTYAAAQPERVASLILVDSFARFTSAPDYPFGAPDDWIDRTIEAAETAMGRGQMLDLFAPSLAADEGLRRAWSRYERLATSPGMAIAALRLVYGSDVRGVLPAIHVPTLVVHRAGAREISAAHGQYLAEHIPGARYVELPGIDNFIWAGDQEAILDEIQAFVTGVRPAPTARRALATVLFTDIVDSTRRAVQLGDRGWRRLLDQHYIVTRRQLDRFDGHQVKTAGDGVLATFDRPARAVRCAAAIREAVGELGLGLRAGLHTGEIELQTDDIAGLAVHIGSRIAALAGAGEILVSSTVKDLVVGSGLEFDDRGSRELKGVPGEWRVFALRADEPARSAAGLGQVPPSRVPDMRSEPSSDGNV
jgi:class 3 adenylate cyclase/pimeloyl-ACP methyl ester carboxylesterase